MIVKATYLTTVLLDADDLDAADHQLSSRDMQAILAEADDGEFIGRTTRIELSSVPVASVKAELVALGNDGTFFTDVRIMTHADGAMYAECHGYDLDGNPLPVEGSFELDGEAVEIDAFVAANEFGAEELGEILLLGIGEEMFFGGGAMPITTLRRVG